MYNVHRGREKKPLTWTDFFTDPDAKPVEPQAAEDILSGFEAASKTLDLVRQQKGG